MSLLLPSLKTAWHPSVPLCFALNKLGSPIHCFHITSQRPRRLSSFPVFLCFVLFFFIPQLVLLSVTSFAFSLCGLSSLCLSYLTPAQLGFTAELHLHCSDKTRTKVFTYSLSTPGHSFIGELHFLSASFFSDRLKLWLSGDYQSLSYAVFCQYLQVTQATNQIVMNCADIDIITASFAPQGGEGEGQTFSTFLPLLFLY